MPTATKDAYNQLVLAKRPTPYERFLLNALWSARAEAVEQAELWSRFAGHRPFNRNVFDVILGRVRKKLQLGWSIALVGPRRYTLLGPGQSYVPTEKDVLSPKRYELYQQIKRSPGHRPKELAAMFGCSTPTVYEAVEQINRSLADYGLRIKNRSGYRLYEDRA